MTIRCLSFAEFSSIRSEIASMETNIDAVTMRRLYHQFYLASVYCNDTNEYDDLLAMLYAAEKTKLLQEALDV